MLAFRINTWQHIKIESMYFEQKSILPTKSTVTVFSNKLFDLHSARAKLANDRSQIHEITLTVAMTDGALKATYSFVAIHAFLPAFKPTIPKSLTNTPYGCKTT